jgi:uncharacterized membrane protein
VILPVFEPVLFGVPITLLFLYFIFYSFVGWAMETTYCSILEKRFVVRGFLLGPICPIYGVGALMMILFFSRFSDHLLLFYLISTVTMSAWEYFVGWFLEATTHIKYWDYSHHKFNLHGRISLFICLWWGFLAYVAVFWVHPEVERLFAVLPQWLCYTLAGSAATLLVLDTITTIRKLTLTAKLIAKLDQVSSELRLQVSLGKAELSDRLEAAVDNLPLELRNHLDDAREGLPTSLDEASQLLREKYDELLAGAERYSRRFRTRYRDLSSQIYSTDLEDIKRAGLRYKEKLMAERAAKKKNRRAS